MLNKFTNGMYCITALILGFDFFQRPVINLCDQDTVGYLEMIDAMVVKSRTTVTMVTLWLVQNLVLATIAAGLGTFRSVKVIFVP